MEANTSNVIRLENKLTVERKKEICKQLVRKELEVLRIQTGLEKILGAVEIYSSYRDDLSSVEAVVQIATDEVLLDKGDSLFWNVVCDGACSLVYGYKPNRKDELEVIKFVSYELVEMIFSSALFKGDVSREKEFVCLFRSKFQNLNSEYIEKREKAIFGIRRGTIQLGG